MNHLACERDFRAHVMSLPINVLLVVVAAVAKFLL